MLRLDLEVTTIEPAGDMVYIEARAPGGAQVALYLPPSALVGVSLTVGQRVPLALELPASAKQAAPPPLRERMSRSPATASTSAAGAAGAAPRSAPTTTRATSTAPPAARADAPNASGASLRPDPSATILSAMLGTPGTTGAGLERDVDDEMDALLGRKKRGPGN